GRPGRRAITGLDTERQVRQGMADHAVPAGTLALPDEGNVVAAKAPGSDVSEERRGAAIGEGLHQGGGAVAVKRVAVVLVRDLNADVMKRAVGRRGVAALAQAGPGVECLGGPGAPKQQADPIVELGELVARRFRSAESDGDPGRLRGVEFRAS